MKRFLPRTLVDRLKLGVLVLVMAVVALGVTVAGFISLDSVQAQAEHSFLDAAEDAATKLSLWREGQRRSVALIAAELSALSAHRTPAEADVRAFLHKAQTQLPTGATLTIADASGETIIRNQTTGAEGDYRWHLSSAIESPSTNWRTLHLSIPTARLAQSLSDSEATSAIRASASYRIIDPDASNTRLVSGPNHPPDVEPGTILPQNDASNTPILYTSAHLPAEPTERTTLSGVHDTGTEWIIVTSAPKSVVYAAANRLLWGMIAGAVIAVAATFILVPMLLGRLGRGIRALMAEMDALGRGDYSHTVTLDGHDELSGLVRRLNNLADALGSVVAEVEQGVEALSNSGMQILSASEEQQAASSQQSTSLQETVSTVEELDLSAKQAAENAQQVVSQAEDASNEILTLSEKAQRINKVGEFIDRISSQIRVLALNASIEASQNEEAESGFSVIASEIRRLAEDTRKSTEEIEALVQDMQDSTNSSVMTMEQMVESVKVIGMAMNQQSVATGQISEAMTDMSRSMSQTVESAESTVIQSDEINAQVAMLQAAVTRLRSAGALLDAAGEGDDDTWTGDYEEESAT